MATDLAVILEDRPGMLAHVGEPLGGAGVNIEGTSGFPSEAKGVLHIPVQDLAAARRALEKAGVEVRGERQVMVLEIEDLPGEFGRVCRRIAEAAVNIDLCHAATNTRLVLGADDFDKARAPV